MVRLYWKNAELTKCQKKNAAATMEGRRKRGRPRKVRRDEVEDDLNII
jgi:hypothetical protein